MIKKKILFHKLHHIIYLFDFNSRELKLHTFMSVWELKKFFPGYKWLTRRLILIASVTKVIRKAASGLPSRYDMETLTWKKNVLYTDFALGTSFLTDHLEDGLFNVCHLNIISFLQLNRFHVIICE